MLDAHGDRASLLQSLPTAERLQEGKLARRQPAEAGVPIALSLLLILRRAHPLAPIRVAAIAGLGVAAMAAFLLQFFHTFDITFLDLAVHLAAGAVVAVGSALVGLSRRTGVFMSPARPM